MRSTAFALAVLIVRALSDLLLWASVCALIWAGA